MRKLKSLRLVSVVLLLINCSMSAKSGRSSEAGIASKGKVITLSKAEFLQRVFNYKESATKWIYGGDEPYIINFYADWYGPYKQVAPILGDLTILCKDDTVVYKINMDKEKKLAATFGIRNIPAFLFIPKGGQPQVSMGALPRKGFMKQIGTFLLKKK